MPQPNRIRITNLSVDDADEVANCESCTFPGTGHVVLCGWHENLFAAMQSLKSIASLLENNNGK